MAKKKVFLHKYSKERLDLQRRIKEAVYDDLLLLEKKYPNAHLGMSYDNHNLNFSRFDNVPNLIKVDHPYRKHEIKVFPRSFYLNKNLNEKNNTPYPKTMASKVAITDVSKRLCENPSYYKAVYQENTNNLIARYILVEHEAQWLDKDMIKIYQSAFYECGYFLATSLLYDVEHGGKIVLQFEPYYYVESERLCVPDDIYHITTASIAEKIKQNGFIASCANIRYRYPNRNYFFLNKDINLMVGYMYEAEKIDKYNVDKNDVAIFTVNTNSIKDDFYTDPMFANRLAVYTYNDVKPNLIQKIELYKV